MPRPIDTATGRVGFGEESRAGSTGRDMCDTQTQEMLRRPQLVRFVAFALFLLAGFEVLACDLASPSSCRLSSARYGTTSGQSDDGDDNCLCCCTHYVAPPGIQLVQFASVGVPPVLVPALGPIPEPARILHPPRA